MTSHEILRVLKSRHPLPEWACFPGLRDATGMTAKRSMDLFAVRCWGDIRMVAYEIKVSRSDFMRELDNPSKREPCESFAHESWLAAPKGLIHKDEVFQGWGLIEIAGGKCFRTKVPSQRTDVTFDKWFVASIARRVAESNRAADAVLCEVGDDEVTLENFLAVVQRKADEIIKRQWPLLRESITGDLLRSEEFAGLKRLGQSLDFFFPGTNREEAVRIVADKARGLSYLRKEMERLAGMPDQFCRELASLTSAFQSLADLCSEAETG